MNRRTAAGAVALLIGLGYLLLGVLAFTVAKTGHSGEQADEGSKMVGVFGVSVLATIVHLAFGVFGLLTAARPSSTRIYGFFLFVTCAGLTAYGTLAAGADTPANILNVNWATNWLHGVTALVGLLLAFLPVKRVQQRSAA